MRSPPDPATLLPALRAPLRVVLEQAPERALTRLLAAALSHLLRGQALAGRLPELAGNHVSLLVSDLHRELRFRITPAGLASGWDAAWDVRIRGSYDDFWRLAMRNEDLLEQVDRNETAAEDLVQEAFLAALSSLDKFRGDSQLYTWLRSIALHKINDFYRHQARQPKHRESSADSDCLELEQTRADEPATHTVMEDEEVRQSVHQALADLPHDYQEVLVLKYLKDMPVLAISQIMGRSPKLVEGSLSRARKAMRDNLGSNNHEA